MPISMLRRIPVGGPMTSWTDQALIVNTALGPVVILGCAHRGIINTLYVARQLTGREAISAVIGGSHLLNISEERLWQTIGALRDLGVKRLGLCHCTDLPVASIWLGSLASASSLTRPGPSSGTSDGVFPFEWPLRTGPKYV